MSLLRTIDIEITNPNSDYYDIRTHELNEEVHLGFRFYRNGQIVSLNASQGSSDSVSATIVAGNILVADETSMEIESNNLATLNVSTNSSYTVFPGKNKIEFKIKKGSEVIYPVAPIILHVSPTVKGNATITPESQGTVAETVRDFPGLVQDVAGKLDDADGEIQTNHIASGAVTNAKIADETIGFGKLSQTLQNTIYDKLDDADGEIQTNHIAAGAVTTGKIASNAVTTGKLDSKAVTTAKIDDAAVTSNQLAQYAVELVNLSLSLQAKIAQITTNQNNISTLQSDVGTIDAALQAIIDGGAPDE